MFELLKSRLTTPEVSSIFDMFTTRAESPSVLRAAPAEITVVVAPGSSFCFMSDSEMKMMG